MRRISTHLAKIAHYSWKALVVEVGARGFDTRGCRGVGADVIMEVFSAFMPCTANHHVSCETQTRESLCKQRGFERAGRWKSGRTKHGGLWVTVSSRSLKSDLGCSITGSSPLRTVGTGQSDLSSVTVTLEQHCLKTSR